MENLLRTGTLTPAYGRDYKSKKALLNDFNEGKDFIYNSPYGSSYCSIRDFSDNAQITFRYSKLRKIFIHNM